MITRRVVLVLGAGASKPYGFPLGSELFNKVVNTDSSTRLGAALGGIGIGGSFLEEFRVELRRSRLPSVDTFLESHEKYIEIGKAAMAFYLIQCEQEKTLYQSNNTEDWYTYLYNMMRPPSLADFAKNKIGFITFNYDRSLEYCLFNALKSGWQEVSSKEAAEALKNVPIIHVHGSLGELPTLGPGGRPYSPNVSPDELRVAMNDIRVIHEGIDNDSAFRKAHEVLVGADDVIFLGFGYNDRNIQRLQLAKHLKQNAQVWAVVHGMNEMEHKYNVEPLFENELNTQFITLEGSVLDLIRAKLDLFRT